MAETVNLMLPLLGVGQAQNVTNHNTALDYVDTALAGAASKSVAGSSDVTLTETEARPMFLVFTGALTGNIQVKVPQRSQMHLVYNNTSGAFTLTVIPVTSGTGAAITQGKYALVMCDAVNVVKLFESP